MLQLSGATWMEDRVAEVVACLSQSVALPSLRRNGAHGSGLRRLQG